MCVVSVHFQENLPSDNNSFKTRHFAVDLKESLPDGANLNEAIAKLFTVAKSNVRSQIQQTVGDLALGEEMPVQASNQQYQQPQQQFEPPQSYGRNAGSAQQASYKQVQFIRSLIKKSRGQFTVDGICREYQVHQLEEISSSTASEIIKRMKGA